MEHVRVLHLITTLDTGGAEMNLARLARGTNREKFESRVVSMLPLGVVGEQIRSAGIPVEALGMPPGQATWHGVIKLFGILRTFRPDILQTWLYHADLLGLLVGKLIGVPIVAWNVRSSDMDFSKYRRLSGLVARLCALLSGLPDVVVVNSRAGRAHHTKIGYRPWRWEIIPNGIETDQFMPNTTAGQSIRAQWNIQEGVRIIGLVGRIDPMKDHPTFLRAAAMLAKDFPAVRFVCVGGGAQEYLRQLQTLTKELGLERHVIWAGGRQDMPAVYNAFDLLALSSFGEGFPNAVAEAMACGVPCVVTDVGDAAQIVGDCGIVVPPKNPVALAEGLGCLLRLSDSEKQILGKRARQRIRDNFSLGKMIAAYEALYWQLSVQKEGRNVR